MIEWMQRHRKYLVVTIWISTIAFVGAGFVGWGAYSFGGGTSSTIAKVGDKNIGVKDFQFAYSNAYNYYNNNVQGGMSQEKAKQMGLEQMVIKSLVDKNLLLNFANELGLSTLDSDLKQKLASEEIFQKDGRFDKEQYKRVLKNIGTTDKEYESNLKQDILLEKLDAIIKLNPNKTTVDMLASTFLMQDDISIKTISVNPEDINVSEDELKKYWEPKKDTFKTVKNYDIKTDFVSANDENASDKEINEYYNEQKYNFTDSEGKIKSLADAKADVTKAVQLAKAKKTALKKYLKVKKGEVKLETTQNIKDGAMGYPIDQLTTANPNDTLKPFKQNDGYIIIQLVKTNLPQPMSFEEAKQSVEIMYMHEKLQELITEKSKEELKTFKGENVGFVSRDINTSLPNLSLRETQYFVSKMFENNSQKGYVILGNKSVLYDIVAQKLLDEKKVTANKEQLTNSASQLENSALQEALLENLRSRYKTEIFYKGN